MLESVRFVLASLRPSECIWLVASLALLAFSVVAFRRRRGIDTLLLLIGSSALLAEHLFWDVFMVFVGGYMLEHGSSAFTEIFYPGDASASWTSNLMLSLLGISLLFPIGFVVYLVKMTRAHLTKRWSERPAAMESKI